MMHLPRPKKRTTGSWNTKEKKGREEVPVEVFEVRSSSMTK